jgi:hypothetical protein
LTRTPARSLVLALFALLLLAAPVSAAPPHLEVWHRLNTDPTNVAPEHEQLQCLPGLQWVCRYDKVPEPERGFHWDRTIAMFHGRDITADAECPGWFPTEICEGTEQVIAGVANFRIDGGGAFRAGHALFFTDGDGLAPLYVYWIDSHVCPWYGSFGDALEANPDASQDCVFAP